MLSLDKTRRVLFLLWIDTLDCGFAGSWKIPQKNSNLKHNSDWNFGKIPTDVEERRLVGLQLHGSSGTALGGKFTKSKQNTGNSYQHIEFSVEHKPQVKEEWMGRIFEQKLQAKEEWMCGGFEQKPQIKLYNSQTSYTSNCYTIL